MSDYDSGDDLLDDVNVDVLMAGTKRSGPPSDHGDNLRPNKRTKLHVDNAIYGTVARSILKEKFGYDNFRHEQSGAIEATLRGDNVLAVFPTGAGKSLCYQPLVTLRKLSVTYDTLQIPGIAFEKLDAEGATADRSGLGQDGSGITIVVSPLIALMKDQVDALTRRGIPAACLDSTKTYDEHKAISAAMREGRLRLLYCAPERLNNEGFVESMKWVPGGIRLVAVDEAHCISEWGHSFRPDYLKVARFVQEIKAERVICLTATATPRVAEDICKAFDITKSNTFRTSPYRPNLNLHAESVDTKEGKFPRLIKFLEDHTGPTLVYVTVQKQAEALAERLSANGFKATAFHAGLRTEDKTRIQDNFMAGRIRIVVATIAFGMGIDKADIRCIVHHDISGTVEEYSQQIGRAGRDGKPSHCVMFLCNDDFWLRENFARGDLPSRQSLQGLLEDIFHQEAVHLPGGGEVIKLSQYSLGRDYDIRPSPLGILLATLELRFGLIRAITPEYSSYQFEAMPRYYYASKNDQSPEAKAILNDAKKAKKWYTIDVNATAKTTGLLRSDIIRKLNEFHDTGSIMLKATSVVNRYKILKKLPSATKEIESIVDKLYHEMEGREEDALQRSEQVADLLTSPKCFALSLAEHFGMELPDGKTKCGHCTFCLTGVAVVLPPKPAPPVDITGIQKILDACDVRDDPRFLARIAFGIKSPRVTQLKLDRLKVFGSLEDHDFKVRPAVNRRNQGLAAAILLRVQDSVLTCIIVSSARIYQSLRRRIEDEETLSLASMAPTK
ncbi:Uu.00g132360.m01.CDS01 [Anthostomella pinea]|uniref:DNA 3'-5' helicase n=1 Tax=Anthostomella pinea TaxID=933095 RepID=A0AAI8VDS0_9PEZI|nr:Uu.00g132360.m01.CDS01 [Anthostomella pinea]